MSVRPVRANRMTNEQRKLITKQITDMKELRLLLAIILAFVFTTDAWAVIAYYHYSGTRTVGNLTFKIYEEYTSQEGGVLFFHLTDYAVLTDIGGTEENVIIPATLDGDVLSTIVCYVDGTVSNAYVKTLTFEGDRVYFKGSLKSSSASPNPDLNYSFQGKLDCPNLNTIIFEGKDIVFNYDIVSPNLQCPNLTDIYFKSSTAPVFSGDFALDDSGNIIWYDPTWSSICTAPGENVTAHVAAWTQAECAQNHESANVFKDLKEVVPDLCGYEITLKSNGGGVIEVWKTTGDDSQLQYVMSSEGGQETVLLKEDGDSFQIRIYYTGTAKPALLRNGVNVSTIDSNDGYCYYVETDPMNVSNYEVIYYVTKTLHFVLTAGVCDKGIEVWKDGALLGSVSKDGGTFYETIENVIEDDDELQIRVPNAYLEKIIVNGEDLTASLPSTTPTDPAYDGYTFYTLGNCRDFTVIEVKYNYSAPQNFKTDCFRVQMSGAGKVHGVIKFVDYSDYDGNMYSFDLEDGNKNTWYMVFHDPRTYGERRVREVEKLEITVTPTIDNFNAIVLEAGRSNFTVQDNGDGSYTYIITGYDMTSNWIDITMPATDFGDVKTLITSKNDIPVGYFYGVYNIFETGYLPQSVQEESSLVNSSITVNHISLSVDEGDEGYDTQVGIIYVQVPLSTFPTFRLSEDGIDYTADCVWHNAGDYINYIGDPENITQFECPADGYYYRVKNIKTDSYIIVDNGEGDVVSPFVVPITVKCYGNGVLNLRNSEGEDVETATDGEEKTANWTKYEAMTLAVTAPEGVDFTNYEAYLLIDGVESHLEKTIDTDGKTVFNTVTMENIATAHTIILVMKQTGGFASPDIIEFADDEVKRICVENWDTDGDGELSKAEAAAVTTLADSETGKSVFRENTTITSFDELQYFTGVTTIDEYAFRNCTALASVKFHDGVKHLHNYSFSGCSSLQHIQLPDKLDGLGSQVFASSGLTSIFIPKTITRIAFDAFRNCKQLLSIVIEDGAAKYSSPNGCNAVIYVQSGVRLLYAGCRNTVIPDDVNAIWTHAFYFQDELKKIVIPNSVGNIRDYAFYGCQNLTSVVMTRTQPLLFAYVGEGAFGGISPDCVLTVPAGTRQAYIDAGWTTKEPDENGVSDPNGLFLKIVEAPAELKGDINVDGTVDISDVTKLVNEILGK